MENSQKPQKLVIEYDQKDLEILHESLADVDTLDREDPRFFKLLNMIRQGGYKIVIEDHFFSPAGRFSISLIASINAGRKDDAKR